MSESKAADPASLDALRAAIQHVFANPFDAEGKNLAAQDAVWKAIASLEAERAGGREAVAWISGGDLAGMKANEFGSSLVYATQSAGKTRVPLYAASPAQEWRPLLKAAKCPTCDGSGGTAVQTHERQLVSRDMASDAGDPSLEGSVFTEARWEQEQCQWCDERAALLASTPEPPK